MGGGEGGVGPRQVGRHVPEVGDGLLPELRVAVKGDGDAPVDTHVEDVGEHGADDGLGLSKRGGGGEGDKATGRRCSTNLVEGDGCTSMEVRIKDVGEHNSSRSLSRLERGKQVERWGCGQSKATGTHLEEM